MQPSAPDFAPLLAIITLIVTVEAMNADVNQGLVELIARLTYALLLAVHRMAHVQQRTSGLPPCFLSPVPRHEFVILVGQVIFVSIIPVFPRIKLALDMVLALPMVI